MEDDVRRSSSSDLASVHRAGSVSIIEIGRASTVRSEDGSIIRTSKSFTKMSVPTDVILSQRKRTLWDLDLPRQDIRKRLQGIERYQLIKKYYCVPSEGLQEDYDLDMMEYTLGCCSGPPPYTHSRCGRFHGVGEAVAAGDVPLLSGAGAHHGEPRFPPPLPRRLVDGAARVVLLDAAFDAMLPQRTTLLPLVSCVPWDLYRLERTLTLIVGVNDKRDCAILMYDLQ